jgi:lysophospholipase L1-like esterase
MVLVWVAGALGALLVAEGVARVALRRGGRFALVPHKRTEFHLDLTALPQLEPVVRTEINAEGERGGPLPTRDRRTYRVLVAGGSAAECYLLDQRSAWPAVVEEELRRDPGPIQAPSIHVGSIARSLLPTASIARLLEGVLPRYPHLDLLITFVGASDVVAWMEAGAPVEYEATVRPDARLFLEGPDVELGLDPRRWALRRYLARWARRVLGRVERREGVGRAIARNRAMRAAAPHRVDEVPDPSGMLASFERHLRRVIELGRSRGARVLVVQQPWIERDLTPEEEQQLWNFGLGRPYAEAVDAYYTRRVVGELMRAVNGVQERVAAELGVECLELQGGVPMDFEHFYDDLHFTPRGARWVGAAVASVVREGSQRAGSESGPRIG